MKLRIFRRKSPVGRQGGRGLAGCAAWKPANPPRPPVPGLVFFAAITPVAALWSLVLLGAEMAWGQFALPTLKGRLVPACVAVFPSLLAQVFFIRAVEIIGSGRAGMFANLVPVFGSGLAILMLGETFATYHAVALLLAITGILIAEYRRSGGD